MANPIPRRSREIVEERDRHRCVRCGSRGSEWHHRRSRRVRDDHTHCPCVGVLLCSTCHRWAHGNPADAREDGLIVSIHETEPYRIAYRSYAGSLYPTCDGQTALA